MSVNIGPWVLGLSVFCEHLGCHLVQLAHQLEERVVGKMFLGKLSLTHVTWVCLSQHSVTKARNNL